MNLLRWLRARLRALVHRDGVAGEIREELEFHVRMRTEEYQRAGDEPADAARRARRHFGNLTVIQDQGYDVRGGGVMETIVQDARYAVRVLRKQHGFSIVALLTLAVGIGLSTALFSVIDAAILHPLPYPHPEQIVDITLATPRPNGRPMHLGPSLNDRALLLMPGGALSHVTASIRAFIKPLTDDDAPERLDCLEIGEGYFDLYGVTLLAGRAIAGTDLQAGAPPVVILGYDYWRRRFGESRGVIGQTIKFDTGSATIVGIAPASFRRTTGIFRPFADVQMRTTRRGTGMSTYGRLRPGISLQQAERELTAAVQHQPGAAPGESVSLESVFADQVSSYATTVRVLAGAVALILLIACVNVAGLLLARGSARLPEMAIRTSIGASRRRLIRQLLIESVILAAIGGALGAAIAWGALGALVANIPMSLPTDAPATLNVDVLIASAALAVLTGVLFGLAPALRLSRAGAATSLARGTPRSGSPLSKRGGQILIATEVMLGVVLLAGSGLMLRSFSRLLAVDLGFEPASFVTLESQPIDTRPEALEEYYPQLLQRIRTLPGVTAAGAINHLPLMGTAEIHFLKSPQSDHTRILLRTVLPGYFEAMGLRLAGGRWPSDADRSLARPVMVINQQAARTFFPTNNPVGGTLGLDIIGGEIAHEVIGVAPDVRYNGPSGKVENEAYVVLTPQSGEGAPRALVTVIRTSNVGGLAEQLRQIATSIGPRVLIDRVRPGTAWLSDDLQRPRQRMVLLTLLGALGLALTLVGIFGMTAYAVARRTQEIGVRMAFGARPGDVVRTIVNDAAWPMAIGLVAGIGGALVATRAIKSFLFNTTPTDPGTFVAVGLTLAACAILAAWIPARRAARVDPVQALRAE